MKCITSIICITLLMGVAQTATASTGKTGGSWLQKLITTPAQAAANPSSTPSWLSGWTIRIGPIEINFWPSEPAPANSISIELPSLQPIIITLPPVIKLPNIAPITMGLKYQDGLMCATPSPISALELDMHRSLLIHDEETLSSEDFSLRRTLQKIATDVSAWVPDLTPESLFRQFWDTQNNADSAQTIGNPNCGDNLGTINGFPLHKCHRSEGREAIGDTATIARRIDDDYKVLALVNRVDLSSTGWENCGEHRIIYGKKVKDEKNLMIFESVLPNPKPGCRSGCRGVTEFWVNLSKDANPSSRALKLADFFYNGLPGFQPAVHSNHYASGASSVFGDSVSGQIRTNQFLTTAGATPEDWTLKEFKTFLSCAGGQCDFDFMPTSVKANPYGHLWNNDVAAGLVPPLPSGNPFATTIKDLSTLAADFQADVLAQVTPTKLANPDINSFTYEVDSDKNAAESQSRNPVVDHYPNMFKSALDTTFETNLTMAGAEFGLSAKQIVNRATALSCAGCHRPTEFGLLSRNSVGPGMTWPDSVRFMHVAIKQVPMLSQPDFKPENFNFNSQGSELSRALLKTFLPHRKKVLRSLANEDICNCKPVGLLFSSSPVKLFKESALIEKISQVESDSLLGVEPESAQDLSASLAEQANNLNRFDSSSLEKVQKVEHAQQQVVQDSGTTLTPPSAAPVPVSLSDKALPEVEKQALKKSHFADLISKEPTRVTFEGLIRTH